MEKSGTVTTNVTPAVWIRLPLVPVIVREYVPGGVVPMAVVIASEDVPAPVIDGGVNVPVAPFGRPLTDKFVVAVNPLTAVVVTV